jgi:hypothetical protein
MRGDASSKAASVARGVRAVEAFQQINRRIEVAAASAF